jgi:hypothetical protein
MCEWQRVQVGMMVTVGGGMLAVGSPAQLQEEVYNLSANPGVTFLYNMKMGSDGASHGNGGSLHRVLCLNTVHRIVLHVRGNVLTFSAGAAAGPVTLQAGSWPLPQTFYILLGIYQEGVSFSPLSGVLWCACRHFLRCMQR